MEPKKRDLMSSAMTDFWASDYNIGQPKINVPRLKSSEDNAYDALWGRGMYKPQPKIQTPQIQYKMPQRQPVPNYRPQVNQGITQAQAIQNIKMQQVRNQRTSNLIANAAKSVAKVGVEVGKRAIPIVKNRIQQTQAYQQFDIQREKDRLWDQYKQEKQKESRQKEIEEYRKKLYPNKN